jgi:hypothetical protein
MVICRAKSGDPHGHEPTRFAHQALILRGISGMNSKLPVGFKSRILPSVNGDTTAIPGELRPG